MVKLQNILLGLTIYFYSIFINILFMFYLLIRGVFRKGPLALIKFFLPSKAPIFDENKFLKEQGIDFKSGFIEVEKDVKIHYKQAGDTKNHRLLLLIHGFPEFWYSWTSVMKELSKSYNVVAIDIRGYNKSSKPEGILRYHARYLAEDIKAVIEGVGYEEATVVGHDWGGIIAFAVANAYPSYVKNLIILNAPHVSGLTDFLKDYPWQQFTRFWYNICFQIPIISDFLFTRFDYDFVNEVFEGPSGVVNQEHRLTKQEIDYYKIACACNIKYPINLYRAARGTFNHIYLPANLIFQEKGYYPGQKVVQKTLIIWGKKDQVLDHRMIDYFQKYIPNMEVRMIENASHWVQRDAPDQVTSLIKEFLAGQPDY